MTTITTDQGLVLPEWARKLDQDDLRRLIAEVPPALRPVIADRLEELQRAAEPWEAQEHQRPPEDDEWFGWVLLAGRGSGKTAAVTHYMNEHAEGPPCIQGKVPHRMGIIAPTFGDASASIVYGDDGLVTINPEIRMVTRDGFRLAVWPNGAQAYLFGVHTRNDVDRLRARGNRCFDLREEIAAWRYLKDGMDQANFGLRTKEGMPEARWVGATTPRPRPTIRALTTDTKVRVRYATTADNRHLSQRRKDELYDRYANTRVGLQELEGKILEEVSGALWHPELIEQYRVEADEVPTLIRVRTAVDPSWGTTNDECGIVVVGLGINRHVYVLADLSKRTTPSEWGILAALGYLPATRKGPEGQRQMRDHFGNWHDDPGDVVPMEWFGRRSERTLGEQNFQGEQVRLVMKLTSRELDRRLQFELVNASRGKRLRAEPVHLLYEQGKVHHVGHLPGLEWQMTNWVPPEASEEGEDEGDPAPPQEGEEEIDPSKWSPDRLDALVFGATNLALSSSASSGKIEVADGRLPRTDLTRRAPRPGGPRLGGIPAATRQGRLAAEQLRGKRVGGQG